MTRIPKSRITSNQLSSKKKKTQTSKKKTNGLTPVPNNTQLTATSDEIREKPASGPLTLRGCWLSSGVSALVCNSFSAAYDACFCLIDSGVSVLP